ncbi:MAG: ribose 5-phosphate isomerase B [Lachnospiraceae bacterium]|nr:ribose 5-phosphate isomerase B [Lachnospiraceae bacterium]
MKIAIGSDHGGYAIKEIIKTHLIEAGHEVDDKGCFSLDSVDYPEYGLKVAKAVASKEADRGVVLCTTGIGISITANKVKGIRAALCSDVVSARLTREHNDANVLALAGGMIGPIPAVEIVDTFMNTAFSNMEKHARRIAEIKEIEEEN